MDFAVKKRAPLIDALNAYKKADYIVVRPSLKMSQKVLSPLEMTPFCCMQRIITITP